MSLHGCAHQFVKKLSSDSSAAHFPYPGKVGMAVGTSGNVGEALVGAALVGATVGRAGVDEAVGKGVGGTVGESDGDGVASGTKFVST